MADNILKSITFNDNDEVYTIEVGLGKQTDQGGEIFNNYADNKAGSYAHAEGNGCEASGEASHAQGYHTIASGRYSTAMGEGTKALGRNQLVIGRYNRNVTQNNLAFIVGGGSGDEAAKRKDVATIDWNGNAHFTGNAKAKRLNIGVSSVPEDALIAINTNNGVYKMDVDGHLSVPVLYAEYGIDTFSVNSEYLRFSDGYGPRLECDTIATGTLANTGGNNVFVVGDGQDFETPDGNFIVQYSNALEIDKEGDITTKGYIQAASVHCDDIQTSNLQTSRHHSTNYIRLGEYGDGFIDGFSIVPPTSETHYTATYHIDMQGNVNQKGTLTVEGVTDIKNSLSCNEATIRQSLNVGNTTITATVECTTIILKSPNGTKFQITIDDNGSLSTKPI